MKPERRWLAPALLGLALSVLAWVGARTAAQDRSGLAPVPWSRTLEPIIVSGEQFPLFEDAPLGDLSVHVLSNGVWAPIPFQFDEVDASGVYTHEDALLDDNDQLVLMARDLGAEATPEEWLDEPGTQDHPRYQLQVTNPLSPTEQGWAYVFRSETLTPTVSMDYVDWDPDTNAIVAQRYVLAFDPANHAAVDSLELNGSGVDALDRGKIRVHFTCYYLGFPILTATLTEEDLAGGVGITPTIDGPVRVGGGHLDSNSWAYGALYWPHLQVDSDGFSPPPPCTSLEIHWLRFSDDWLDPGITGMAPAVYFDANVPAGVPVDGSPDAVPATPVTPWQQVSGDLGTIVRVLDVALEGGSLSTYYKDDATLDPEDTGDGLSFSDAGFRVDSPAGLVTSDLLTFVLDADQPSLGPLYESYYLQPLQVEIAVQDYVPPCIPNQVNLAWAPVPVYVGAETTFSGTVGGGLPPFTYAWTFGDDGSQADGNPVTHTYALSGTFSVTLTVSNACGAGAREVRSVAVQESEMDGFLYLPLIIRALPRARYPQGDVAPTSR